MAIKKARNLATEEKNKKIEHMDIEELKPYLCMKHGQNPEKCNGCLSIAGCKAGQRATVLMNQRDKKQTEEAVPKKVQTRGLRGEAVIDYIREVIRADDPRQFLIDNEGLTAAQARKKLENWRRNHAELFVGVTWSKKRCGRKYDEEHEKAQRALFEECMATGDPIGHYMKVRGCVAENARAMIKNMKKKFGGYVEETKMAEPEVTVNATIDNGDVSVEEFLNEIGAVSAEEIFEKVNEPETKELPIDKEVNACGIPNVLIEKENEIGSEMNRIKLQIDELKRQYAILKKAMDSLNFTTELISKFSPKKKLIDQVMDISRYYEGE